MSYSVQIHLYDLSGGMAKTMSRNFLGKQIDGIWHTGIIVYGKEFYYGGGICQDPPGKTPYGNPVQTIHISDTEIPEEIFIDFLKEINYKFTSEKYDLFENNCNNFTDTCCEFLTGQKIPSFITGLPKEVLATPMGKMIKPMIDSMQKNMTQNSHPIFSSPSQGGTNSFGAPSHVGQISPNDISHAPHFIQNEIKPLISTTSFEEFSMIVKQTPAVIVDFFSYTCPPCMKIKPFFERLAQDFHSRCPNLKFISVDTQIARQIAMTYQIQSIPTFIGFLNGNVFQRFSGADTKKLESLAYTLESKVKSNNSKGVTTEQVNTTSFQVFNPNKKEFFTFSSVNYALPIKSINTVIEGDIALVESDAKEIFTRFAQNPQENVTKFSGEDREYLVNWIFETVSYLEISEKVVGFLDLVRMLSINGAFLDTILKHQDKISQLIKYFDKSEDSIKGLHKGLKLVLLRLITNLSASEKSKVFFQQNLNPFVELWVRVGHIYKDDKAALYPVIMTLWNLVQIFYNTKEAKDVMSTITHFSRVIYNDSNEPEILLPCTLILTWLSFQNADIKKETETKLDKAKLAKLEFSEDQNLGKLTRDLSDILQGKVN